MARFRTHTNPFNYFRRMEAISLVTVLPGYTGMLDVEIGFGQGMFVAHYAQKYPDRQIMGVEVRKKVVETVQARLGNALPNAYLVHGSGQIAIEDLAEPGSIGRLFVFHPDPWFKKRHHNRRVLNPRFLDAIAPKLRIGCLLYVSTDVALLFEEMDCFMRARGDWVAVEDPDFWEQDYKTHWQQFSEKDHRDTCYGVYQFIG